VDGLKERDPGPSSGQGQNTIHNELVPPPSVASNHIISAFQWGHKAFHLVSRWRQLTTTLLAIPIFLPTHFMGRA
jgi:hypothetical protein